MKCFYPDFIILVYIKGERELNLAPLSVGYGLHERQTTQPSPTLYCILDYISIQTKNADEADIMPKSKKKLQLVKGKGKQFE